MTTDKFAKKVTHWTTPMSGSHMTSSIEMSLPSVEVRTNSSDWLCFLPPAPRGNQCMSVGKISAGNFMTCLRDNHQKG